MTFAPYVTFSITAAAASCGPCTMRYSSSAIARCAHCKPGNCPPSGDNPGPETNRRGPSMLPSSIARLSAVSPNRPELPRSRTVVIPAARNVRARAAPCNARNGEILSNFRDDFIFHDDRAIRQKHAVLAIKEPARMNDGCAGVRWGLAEERQKV